ncbi:MAG: hypothetical protein PHU44_00660 [Syntrophales bacterium]|nr:hypothetical protein [Syntrophales bacterium]MDD5643072.1 hypothetical protein [Syntrophales bacterium]
MNKVDDIFFSKVKANPSDILDGLNNLPLQDVISCKGLADELEYSWLPSEKYLEWAKKGISEKTDYGFNIAITFSKRSVCRRIDTLILYNHLYNYRNKPYPTKIDVLTKIGLKPVDILHDLIISLRNELEHSYKSISERDAQVAIQLAEMYIDATQHEIENGSITVVNSSFLFGQSFSSHGCSLWFNGLSRHPMVVIDIFQQEIKIVFPVEKEIKYAKLNSFSNDEIIYLSTKLRTHYNETSRSYHGISPRAFKLLLEKSSI